MQPSEIRALKPGDARELIERLEKEETEEWKVRADMQNEQVKALIDGIGQVVKAVDNQSKMLAKALSRPSPLG